MKLPDSVRQKYFVGIEWPFRWLNVVEQALEAWFSGRGLPMFSSEDLKSLDLQYFSIISTDAYDVTIMSRNTGHYWYLHNPEYPEKGTVIIFHKHKASHPYHQHGRANTLRQAVRGIRKHDRWQMNGRK